MFVCRLVSGVRSSWEASATNRRCVSSDSSSEASIVLKEAPRRASSSRPPSGTRSLGSPVSAIRSAAAVRRRTGASVAPETRAPAAAAISNPAERDEEQDEPQAVEVVVDVVDVAGDYDGATGDREHALAGTKHDLAAACWSEPP